MVDSKLKNPYFDFHDTVSEQELLNDLIQEAISMYGHNLLYIPRKFVNKDELFGEDILSKFEDTFELVFYVASNDSYEGDGKLLSKFGLDIKDQSKLVVSKSVFHEVLGEADEEYEIEGPREGDLIYIPFNKRLCEIVYVSKTALFFQLGSLYTYELTVEYIDYSHEGINTGIDDIDGTAMSNKGLEFKVTDGSGNYIVGENVYIGTDFLTADFTAIVESWDPATKKIVVSDIDGAWAFDARLKGVASMVDWKITGGIIVSNLDTPGDGEIIQEEADEVLYKDEDDDDFGFGNF